MPRKVRVTPLVSFGVLLVLVLAPSALAAKPTSGATGGSTGCSINPVQVGLDQVWTASAWGLPKSEVNLIVTFPDGSKSTGPITVAADGTYTTTGSSNMSASWGFIAPEQLGTYRYQFVGQVRWPAGTYSKQFANCSVVVS
jgi:hypothetical protein